MKRKFYKQLLPVLLAVISGGVYGQVTIGSGIEPVGGALLDLKEEQTDGVENAKKGLMLPRVKLTEPDKLYPMFETTPGSGTANADYNDATKKTAEDARHTGLTVYNLTQCDGKFARGVYTWTGAEWVQLTKNPVLTGNPVLTFTPALPAGNPAFIEIPSGQDARTVWTSAWGPSVAFTGTNRVEGLWSNTVDGGLAFNANALAPSFPATWTASPISDISVWPDAMTTADLTSNPFLSRESKLTITGIAGTGGPCPGGTNQTQEITLNQTNYAIVPGTVASPTSLLVLRSTGQQSLNILSNAKWQATASNGTVAWTDILSTYTTAQTGSEMHDGSYNTDPFNYNSTDPVVQGRKYETAQITFSDTESRAKPVTVTVMQCQGTPDMSSVTTNANNTETSTTPAPSSWSGQVVRHAAKAGVYAEFYSAEFGPAGRWMTTNLAATAYDDGVTHKAGRTLEGPNANSGLVSNKAFWCYPNGGSGGNNNSEYIINPHIGLLYTWDAATAGKGGTSGEDGTGDEGGSNAYAKVQGICPSGWHLPSDYEWTELENAIIKNTTTYAYVGTNIDPGDNSALMASSQAGWRGTTHGQAMKEMCGLGGVNFNGTSLSPYNGGVAVFPTGSAGSGVTFDTREMPIFIHQAPKLP